MATNKWTHYYSGRRCEISVFDLQDRMVFMLNSEDVLENGLDKMSHLEQADWLKENYSAEIEDIMESRA